MKREAPRVARRTLVIALLPQMAACSLIGGEEPTTDIAASDTPAPGTYKSDWRLQSDLVASGAGLPLASYLDFDAASIGSLNNNVDILLQLGGGFRILGMNGVRFTNVGLGGSVPSYVGCSTASRSESPIYTPSLQPDTRLCFDTTGANLAGLYVQQIQPADSLLIPFVTWRARPSYTAFNTPCSP